MADKRIGIDFEGSTDDMYDKFTETCDKIAFTLYENGFEASELTGLSMLGMAVGHLKNYGWDADKMVLAVRGLFEAAEPGTAVSDMAKYNQ